MHKVQQNVYLYSRIDPMKKLLTLLVLLLMMGNVTAQISETVAPSYIRSIVFTQLDEDYGNTPIIPLGEGLRLEFDDIIGDEADYYYRIEFYNKDWTPSELSKSEYLEGFDNLRIASTGNSFNTLQLYTHYKLVLPNANTRALKRSGNYMLHVYDQEGEEVFSRKFMIYENLTQVRLAIVRPREVKNIPYQQTLHFSVHPEDIILKSPSQSVDAVLLQNANLKTAITDLSPQFTSGNELIYRYDGASSFLGGNEYLSFDSKDLRAATSSIERIELNQLYHHYLHPIRMRSLEAYTYNPDINGSFLINTTQGSQKDLEAEYVWVHFSLQAPQVQQGEVHIYGSFNNFHLDESTRLTYNSFTERYEGARLFKQGFYNYKYVLLTPEGNLEEGYFSGNHQETENQYTALIYYREPGGRYDRIIGMGTANSREFSGR